MTIHLFSADHRTQGLETVARLGADVVRLGPSLRQAVPLVEGVLVLSTCNRLALLLDAPDVAGLDESVAGFLAQRTGLPPAAVHLAAWKGHAAHVELFATASGLESMVVGEREIAGQLRRAMCVAAEEGTLTTDLARAVEHASSASRRVASTTGLAGTGRSVVAVALDLAERDLPPLQGARVLVVGTGAYAGATVTVLKDRGVRDIEVYSRSDRAQAFAQGRGLRAVDEAGLGRALEMADLVVACRGLGTPVLTRELLAPAVRLRQPHEPALLDRHEDPRSRAEPGERPLVVVDLALSRDVEPSVGSLPGILLLDLPAVQRAVPEVDDGQVAAARAIIEEEVTAFERLQSGRRMDPVVRRLRGLVDQVLTEEIEGLRVVDGQVAAQDAVRALQHLAARLVHHPTVAARRAGEQGRAGAYLDNLGLLLGEEVAQALVDGVALDPGCCPALSAGLPTLPGRQDTQVARIRGVVDSGPDAGEPVPSRCPEPPGEVHQPTCPHHQEIKA